jgi:hypothetical protein
LSKTTFHYKNLYNVLKSEYKDDVFALFNSLSLEEIIALKLELSSNNSTKIMKEALILYAVAATKSKKEAARFLGISKKVFNDAYSQFEIEKYFSDRLDG